MSRCTLAALVSVVVACGGGDDGKSNPDASEPDAAVDAPEIDAAVPGPVTVTVRSMGAPVPGVDVVWTDPAGAIISHGATNNVGAATETVFAGSAVTIAITGPTNTVTGTYLGIEPGDDLTWVFAPPAPTRRGDLTVTLPATSVVNAARYVVDIGCNRFTVQSVATPVTGTITTDCLGSDQNIDLVATAQSANGTVLGYVVRTDVATVANGNTAVNLTGSSWSTTTDPLSVMLTNVPFMSTSQLQLEAHFRSDGLDFRGVNAGGVPSAATVNLSSAYFQGGIVDQLQYVLYLVRSNAGAPAGLSILIAGQGAHPASVAHDLSTLLPTISGATASNDGGRLQFAWTADGSFAAADGALLVSSWREGAVNHQTYVMAPPGAQSPLDVPPLPDELSAYRTTATSQFMTPTVLFVDADFLAGYQAFRPVGWGLIGTPATGGLPLTGGTIRAALGGQAP